MKKLSLFVLMFLLELIELYLCTAFLPVGWQHALNNRIPDIWPKAYDMTSITHPLLSQEMEQVFRENFGLRMALYVITIALLAANAWFIYFILRLFRGTQRSSEDR